MAGCAPIVRAFERGEESAEPWKNPETRAWGLRVPAARGDFLILRAVRGTGGVAVAVPEEALEPEEEDAPKFAGVEIDVSSHESVTLVGRHESKIHVVQEICRRGNIAFEWIGRRLIRNALSAVAADGSAPCWIWPAACRS